MATSADRSRTALHEALDGAVGPDNADTLMGYLPPVGWADVATKSDLASLGNELRAEIARTEANLERAIRAQMAWTVGSIFAAVASAVTLSQILG